MEQGPPIELKDLEAGQLIEAARRAGLNPDMERLHAPDVPFPGCFGEMTDNEVRLTMPVGFQFAAQWQRGKTESSVTKIHIAHLLQRSQGGGSRFVLPVPRGGPRISFLCGVMVDVGAHTVGATLRVWRVLGFPGEHDDICRICLHEFKKISTQVGLRWIADKTLHGVSRPMLAQIQREAYGYTPPRYFRP